MDPIDPDEQYPYGRYVVGPNEKTPNSPPTPRCLSPDHCGSPSKVPTINPEDIDPNEVVVPRHLGLADCTTESVFDLLVEHKEYTVALKNFNEGFIRDDPTLRNHEKAYLGIMAASRHKCTSLIKELKPMFLYYHGPEEWLKGLSYASPKMKAFHTANIILGHRPWLFRSGHIRKLLLEKSLNMEQVVLGLVLLSHYHVLSSMYYALGMEAATREYTPPRQRSPQRPLAKSPTIVKTVVDTLKELGDGASSGTLADRICRARGYDSPRYCHELDLEQFNDPEVEERYKEFSKYSPNMSFVYQPVDVDLEKEDALNKCIEWPHVCFDYIRRYVNERLALYLDDKFNLAYKLTYHRCENIKEINTKLFRKAMWNYIQRFYGIIEDSYKYEEIDRIIDRKTQIFLKQMAIAPENLLSPDLNEKSLMNSFTHSEKVHVTIMATEAKLQVLLTYSMCAIEIYNIEQK